MVAAARTKIVRHSPTLDRFRQYFTDDPTPSKLASLLKDVDAGNYGALIEINEEIERKDAHLRSEASKRRSAITSLPWSIEPDSEAEDQEAAKATADFCRGQVDHIRCWMESSDLGFNGLLDHLATAIGPGMAAAENIWWRARLTEIVLIPGYRLLGSYVNDEGIFVITDESLYQGIELRPWKFIVFLPHATAGYPIGVPITYAQCYLWIIKHFALADWTAYNETFGQPARVATYKRDLNPDEKRELKKMMENMGANLWAMFSDAIDLKMLEASRASQPFESLIEWVEKKQTILYLGQTLTTDTQGVGSLALGRVHAQVSASITLGDLRREETLIRNSILRPMVRLRWPRSPMPVPVFKRRVMSDTNIEIERLELDKLRFVVKDLGIPLDREVILERLGLPMPKKSEIAA